MDVSLKLEEQGEVSRLGSGVLVLDTRLAVLDIAIDIPAELIGNASHLQITLITGVCSGGVVQDVVCVPFNALALRLQREIDSTGQGLWCSKDAGTIGPEGDLAVVDLAQTKLDLIFFHLFHPPFRWW